MSLFGAPILLNDTAVITNPDVLNALLEDVLLTIEAAAKAFSRASRNFVLLASSPPQYLHRSNRGVEPSFRADLVTQRPSALFGEPQCTAWAEQDEMYYISAVLSDVAFQTASAIPVLPSTSNVVKAAQSVVHPTAPSTSPEAVFGSLDPRASTALVVSTGSLHAPVLNTEHPHPPSLTAFSVLSLLVFLFLLVQSVLLHFSNQPDNSNGQHQTNATHTGLLWHKESDVETKSPDSQVHILQAGEQKEQGHQYTLDYLFDNSTRKHAPNDADTCGEGWRQRFCMTLASIIGAILDVTYLSLFGDQPTLPDACGTLQKFVSPSQEANRPHEDGKDSLWKNLNAVVEPRSTDLIVASMWADPSLNVPVNSHRSQPNAPPRAPATHWEHPMHAMALSKHARCPPTQAPGLSAAAQSNSYRPSSDHLTGTMNSATSHTATYIDGRVPFSASSSARPNMSRNTIRSLGPVTFGSSGAVDSQRNIWSNIPEQSAPATRSFHVDGHATVNQVSSINASRSVTTPSTNGRESSLSSSFVSEPRIVFGQSRFLSLGSRSANNFASSSNDLSYVTISANHRSARPHSSVALNSSLPSSTEARRSRWLAGIDADHNVSAAGHTGRPPITPAEAEESASIRSPLDMTSSRTPRLWRIMSMDSANSATRPLTDASTVSIDTTQSRVPPLSSGPLENQGWHFEPSEESSPALIRSFAESAFQTGELNAEATPALEENTKLGNIGDAVTASLPGNIFDIATVDQRALDADHLSDQDAAVSANVQLHSPDEVDDPIHFAASSMTLDQTQRNYDAISTGPADQQTVSYKRTRRGGVNLAKRRQAQRVAIRVQNDVSSSMMPSEASVDKRPDDTRTAVGDPCSVPAAGDLMASSLQDAVRNGTSVPELSDIHSYSGLSSTSRPVTPQTLVSDTWDDSRAGSPDDDHRILLRRLHFEESEADCLFERLVYGFPVVDDNSSSCSEEPRRGEFEQGSSRTSLDAIHDHRNTAQLQHESLVRRPLGNSHCIDLSAKSSEEAEISCEDAGHSLMQNRMLEGVVKHDGYLADSSRQEHEGGDRWRNRKQNKWRNVRLYQRKKASRQATTGGESTESDSHMPEVEPRLPAQQLPTSNSSSGRRWNGQGKGKARAT
ncbi:hypothetical protein CERSUDRAFT_96304 [Gelatoporia subvermispora B]|uniref:Uncharacterized protein n=1 Tax=Ceriporiopsis subvermispora (strain B) TaxID=914234 RepID=M2QGA8_CERS8|nr:hypothetical protein CERSUDRAFT_96304 [Gelatoporia subvermispora B]